jgi:hypothetical protein
VENEIIGYQGVRRGERHASADRLNFRLGAGETG